MNFFKLHMVKHKRFFKEYIIIPICSNPKSRRSISDFQWLATAFRRSTAWKSRNPTGTAKEEKVLSSFHSVNSRCTKKQPTITSTNKNQTFPIPRYRNSSPSVTKSKSNQKSHVTGPKGNHHQLLE